MVTRKRQIEIADELVRMASEEGNAGRMDVDQKLCTIAESLMNIPDCFSQPSADSRMT